MFLRKLIMTTLLALSLGAPGQVPSMWRATVLAGESGEPLGGITFRDADGEVIATSAADGQVAFASEPGVRLELAGSARIASHLILDGVPRDLGVLTLERSAVLLGRLLDPDGRPAAGRRVWLVSPYVHEYEVRDPDHAGHLYRLETTTDVDGSFRFEGFWTRSYGHALLVSAGGQVIRRFGSIPRETIDIGSARLSPLASVRGKVVNAEGQPATGARVAFALLDVETSLEEDPERLRWRVTTADDNGEYAIGLAPGVYQAMARGEGMGEIRGVEIRDGEVDTVVPPMRLGPARTIGGRVVDGSGSAEAEPIVLDGELTGRVRIVVDVCRESPNRCEVTHQTLDETRVGGDSWGSLRTLGVPDELELEAGAWVIRAKAAGYVAEERTVVVETGQEQEVRFDLARQADAVDVQVRVLGPKGHPASLTSVGLVVEDTRRDVHLASVLTGADGIATFSAVPAGRYSLRATRLGYSESARRWLDFPTDDPEVELRLVAKSRSARIGGTVVGSDGLPVGGAAVFALEDDNDSTVVATVTAFDGSFLMKVPARGYRLSAYATHGGLALPGEAIFLEERERTTAHTLVLRQGVDVDGEFSTTGEPDRQVSFYGPQEWPRFYFPIWTTSGGTYHVRGLPPGSWTFAPRDYSSDLDAKFVIEVRADLTVEAPTPVFDYASYFNVSGRVLLHGVPLADATVSVRGGWTTTDAEGRFALRGRQGVTEVLVRLMAPFRHEIEPLDGDREIEIVAHGAQVAGKVLDKITGAPIRTAEIFLQRDDNVGFYSHSYDDSHRVDGLGRFDFGTLPAGRWTVRVSAEGYTREIVEIDIEDEPFDMLFEHEPTPGLRLHVSDTKGDAAYNVGLAIERPGEAVRVFDGWFGTVHDLWWPSAPTGRVLLTAASPGSSLFYRGEIENIGAPIDIVLRPGGRLEIYVPEDLLPDESFPAPRRSAEWQAQLIGADGVPVPARDYMEMTTRFQLRRGDPMIDVEGIPPGEYRLVVTGPEGFEWSTRVAVRAGDRARVLVPSR